MESLTVAIAALLLSLFGVPATATQDLLYLTNVRHAFLVKTGVVDWMGFLLLDFCYVFAIWTYVNVKEGQLKMKSCLALGAVGFPIIFLGNALKLFVQVFYVVSSGNLAYTYDSTFADFVDALGFGVMFAVVLVTAVGTCISLAKWMPGRLGWPPAWAGSGKKPA